MTGTQEAGGPPALNPSSSARWLPWAAGAPLGEQGGDTGQVKTAKHGDSRAVDQGQRGQGRLSGHGSPGRGLSRGRKTPGGSRGT